MFQDVPSSKKHETRLFNDVPYLLSHEAFQRSSLMSLIAGKKAVFRDHSLGVTWDGATSVMLRRHETPDTKHCQWWGHLVTACSTPPLPYNIIRVSISQAPLSSGMTTLEKLHIEKLWSVGVTWCDRSLTWDWPELRGVTWSVSVVLSSSISSPLIDDILTAATNVELCFPLQ